MVEHRDRLRFLPPDGQRFEGTQRRFDRVAPASRNDGLWLAIVGHSDDSFDWVETVEEVHDLVNDHVGEIAPSARYATGIEPTARTSPEQSFLDQMSLWSEAPIRRTADSSQMYQSARLSLTGDMAHTRRSGQAEPRLRGPVG